MKDRRSFLKEVCPTVAFAFFGISFLEACSSDGGDDDVDITSPGNGSGTGSGSGSGSGSNTQGYTKSGNTYTIDLTHSNFSQLSSVGGWMNGQSIGIPALFLRISQSSIQAYTNVCPHNGNNDRWELIENGDKFRCNYHSRSYATDNCTSALKCYNPSLSSDTLTLVVS